MRRAEVLPYEYDKKHELPNASGGDKQNSTINIIKQLQRVLTKPLVGTRIYL